MGMVNLSTFWADFGKLKNQGCVHDPKRQQDNAEFSFPSQIANNTVYLQFPFHVPFSFPLGSLPLELLRP